MAETCRSNTEDESSRDDISPSSKDSLTGIRMQLAILGSLRCTEAIAWTSIFPYIYFMIQSFEGVPESDIVFYASLMIALFTFCEFLSGMVWAKIGDMIGRKRTLLIGQGFAMITALFFGFSRSIFQAALVRSLGGLSNPNVGLVQTCVVELAKGKNQRAKALSLVTSIRSMGNLIGPVLGGILADPAALYPSLFPPDSIWTSYRYLLPNLVVALLQFFPLALGFLFLEETHPERPGQLDHGLRIGRTIISFLRSNSSLGERYSYARLGDDQPGSGLPRTVERGYTSHDAHELQRIAVDDEDGDEILDGETQPHKAFTLQVILQIVSVSLLAFHKVSSDTIMPSFLAASSSPTKIPQANLAGDVHDSSRGFGYSSRKIGVILLSQSIVAILVQAKLVPFLIGEKGALRAYRIILCLYPAMYICTPFLPLLSPPLPLLAVVLELWIKVALSSIGYICSAILIANVAPSPNFLAQINGAAAAFSCLARSVGPLLTGKLFSVGLEVGYAGIAFWTLAVVALVGGVESMFLRDHM